jgi:hypothetical protein
VWIYLCGRLQSLVDDRHQLGEQFLGQVYWKSPPYLHPTWRSTEGGDHRPLTTVLPEHGVRTTRNLRTAATKPGILKDVERAWRATPGQRSGITWDCALMLAQIPGVKADRVVIRYVARAIGVPPEKLSPQRAAQLVTRVAEVKDWKTIHLDHAIWRFESGRPFQNDVPATD